MKTSKRTFFIVIVLALLAGGAWLLDSGDNGPAYRTAKITRGNITEVVTATGTLNPIELVNVGTQVSGQVSKLYVAVNDHVHKGQLMAEIDPALLAAQVKQDKAALDTGRINYEQAGRDLERERMLFGKDYVAKADVEHAEQAYISYKNAYDLAETQLERDQVNLNYAKIVAPIDGVIISQDVKLGETVAASFQTPNMFKIAGDLKQMKIDVSFSESDISKVKAGMPASFTVDAFPDRTFSGRVKMVNLNPTSQQGVVTYTATVEVANDEKILLPGMTAYVNVMLSEKPNVLRASASALRFTPPPVPVGGLQRLLSAMKGKRPQVTAPNLNAGGSKTIYLLRNDKPVAVPVTAGASDESLVEVSGQGIAEGDDVITGIAPSGSR